uniref:Uncharacterized protein n=1 Tax=Caenorhabditis japonica TaxID=281687 RepID=A0A8R1IJZ1_CAEJA
MDVDEDDRINFWRTKSATWLAIKFLSIPASSASMERRTKMEKHYFIKSVSPELKTADCFSKEDCDKEVAENSPIDTDLGQNYEMVDFNNVEEDDMEFEEFRSSLPRPNFSLGSGNSNDATQNKIPKSEKQISKRVVKTDISAPATRRRRVNKEN